MSTRGQGHCLTFFQGHSDLYFQAYSQAAGHIQGFPLEFYFREHMSPLTLILRGIWSDFGGHGCLSKVLGDIWSKSGAKYHIFEGQGKPCTSVKFHIEPLWSRGTKVCSNDGGQDGCRANACIWLNLLKKSSLEPKGQNGNLWMTFDFCTERSNILPAESLENRLAQA